MTSKKNLNNAEAIYGEEKEEEVPQLDIPNLDYEIDEQPKKKSFFSQIFRKKDPEKNGKTPDISVNDNKKNLADEKKIKSKTFWDYLITIITTIVATMAVTVLLYTIISSAAEKRMSEERESYLKTVYQLGDVDVPSFEYFLGVQPTRIDDKKIVNVDDPSQTLSYSFVFTSDENRAGAKSDYILILKQHEFIVTGETISRSFNAGKIIVNATFNQSDDIANSIYVLVVSFSRNI